MSVNVVSCNLLMVLAERTVARYFLFYGILYFIFLYLVYNYVLIC